MCVCVRVCVCACVRARVCVCVCVCVCVPSLTAFQLSASFDNQDSNNDNKADDD